MKRKFLINMTQKGKFQFQCKFLCDNGYIVFHKTEKKQVEIAEIDFDGINELHNRERQERGQFFESRIKWVERILGIDKYNPYHKVLVAREIKDTDKEGYKQISLSSVEQETDKAYKILDRWIAKSQTLVERDSLFIKDWLYFKEFFYC